MFLPEPLGLYRFWYLFIGLISLKNAVFRGLFAGLHIRKFAQILRANAIGFRIAQAGVRQL